MFDAFCKVSLLCVCVYVCVSVRERDWIYFYHQVCNCAKLCKTFFFFVC